MDKETREEVEVESGGQNAPFSLRARRARLQSCFLFALVSLLQYKARGGEGVYQGNLRYLTEHCRCTAQKGQVLKRKKKNSTQTTREINSNKFIFVFMCCSLAILISLI